MAVTVTSSNILTRLSAKEAALTKAAGAKNDQAAALDAQAKDLRTGASTDRKQAEAVAKAFAILDEAGVKRI